MLDESFYGKKCLYDWVNDMLYKALREEKCYIRMSSNGAAERNDECGFAQVKIALSDQLE